MATNTANNPKICYKKRRKKEKAMLRKRRKDGKI